MSKAEEINPQLEYDRNVPVRFYLQAYPYWTGYRIERCTFQGSKQQSIVLEQSCSTIVRDCQYSEV